MILQTLRNRPKPIFPNGPRCNFPYAGYVNNSSLNDAGSQGDYWSRTAVSAGNAYYLWFYSSNVYPANNLNRYVGFSIRCVATT